MALERHFLAHPAAYGGWMRIMVRNYLDRCQAVGAQPEAHVLVRVLEGLGGGGAATR